MASEGLSKIDKEITGLARPQEQATQDAQDMAEVQRALEDRALASRASAEEAMTAMWRHEAAFRTAEDLSSEFKVQELDTAKLYWQLEGRAEDLANTLDSQRELIARTTAEVSAAQDQANQVWSDWLVQEERRVAEEAQASKRTERAARYRTKLRTAEEDLAGLQAEIEVMRPQGEDLQNDIDARAEAIKILAQIREPGEAAAAA